MSNGTANSVVAAGQTDGKPMTLIRLGIQLIKSYIKSIPTLLVWTIVRAAVCFLIVLFLHTYFVVVKNEGFAPDPNNPFYRLISFQDTRVDALLFWSICAFLVSTLAGRIWLGGPVKFFKEIAATPGWTIKSFKGAGKQAGPVLLGGIAVSLLGSFITNSGYVLLTTALVLLLSYTSYKQGLWFLFLSTGWSDFKRIFLKKNTIDYNTIFVLIVGLILGPVLAVIIPWNLETTASIIIRIVLILLCAAGIIFIKRKNLSPQTLLLIGGILIFEAILLQNAVVYADDGGWVEAGGTFASWWNSPGRADAINMGWAPSLLAALSALLGSGNLPKPPPIPEFLDFHPEDWKWIREGDKWVLYQTNAAGQKFGTGIPQSIFAVDPQLAGDLIRIYTTPTCDYNPAVKTINDLMDELGTGYTNRFSLSGWQSMNQTQKEESMRALSHLIANVAGVDPKKFSFNFINDPNNGLNGQWDPNSRTIELNSNSANFNNPLKMIKTLCHEMRHAAQEDASANLGSSADYRNLITFNNTNYQTSSDYTRYAGQLLERDADGFGRAISRAVMVQVLDNKYGQ